MERLNKLPKHIQVVAGVFCLHSLLAAFWMTEDDLRLPCYRWKGWHVDSKSSSNYAVCKESILIRHSHQFTFPLLAESFHATTEKKKELSAKQSRKQHMKLRSAVRLSCSELSAWIALALWRTQAHSEKRKGHSSPHLFITSPPISSNCFVVDNWSFSACFCTTASS